MPDVLLIQPPIRDFYLTAKRTIPYGLGLIASACIQKGYSVSIFDGLATSKSRQCPMPEEMAYLTDYYGAPDISPFRLFHNFYHFGYSYEHITRVIREADAFLIGISSLFTPYEKEALKIARLAKSVSPGSTVVLGGHHPTALPHQVMAHPAIDFVIRGDGEVAVPELVNVLKKSGDIQQVPGIVFRKKDNSLHVSPPAITRSLDDMPPSAYSLTTNKYYRRHRKDSMVLVTSRGCPMSCSYCSLGTHSFFPYRQRTVDSVIREIETVTSQFDIRFIDFEDENLSLNKTWILDLLQRMRNQFGTERFELRAMNGLFPLSLDDDIIATMKAGGFKTLNLSLGSTCPKQLKRWQRPNVIEAFEKALATTSRNGMNAVSYIIGGAPGQTPAQTLSDLGYLAEKRTLIGLSIFYPSPGSMDYATLQEHNMLPQHCSLFRSSALPLSHTTSRLESVTLLRLSRVINFIKHLIDMGAPLPAPAPFTEKQLSIDDSPLNLGKRILSGFLYDGKLRGITPNGTVYKHRIALDVSHAFKEKYNTLHWVGTK